jgi:YqaJ-like viral recombinase domain
MNFAIIDAEQRSEMWRAARAGRATGSRACDILSRIKTGEAAARRDYRIQLAIEQITKTPMEDDGWLSKDVQRGIDLEPAALSAYEVYQGNLIRKTGFLQMNGVMAGCSIDGDVNNFEGIVEFKCPKSATHVSYLRTREIPRDYMAQITHNLWVTGAQWCDWVSFDDRLPEDLGLQFLCIRVKRDEAAIRTYEADVNRFLAEVKIEARELLAMKRAA